MARAICQNNHVYDWPNKRGYKLSDFNCPECNTPGKAVRDYKLANRLPLAKRPSGETHRYKERISQPLDPLLINIGGQ